MALVNRFIVSGSVPDVTTHPTGRPREAGSSGARAGHKSYAGKVAAATVFLASGAVLVLEVVGLRLVGPYMGVTLQTSSAVIGVSLAAIAYGAWTGGFLADRSDPRRLIPPAFLLAAAATAVTLPLVRWAGELLRDTAALGILLLTALAVFIPAALLSAITPMVVKLQLGDVRRTGQIVGQLSSIGTVGGITATLGTGFVLVAALPSSAILLGLAGTLAAAGVALYLVGGEARPRWAARADRSRRWGATAAVIGLVGAGLSTVAPNPCDAETAYHCAKVVTDASRPSGRVLLLNSARHSYVDLADPRHLEFAYTQWFAAVIDEEWPAPEPVRALHLGGGGFTMPRYLAATRPGSYAHVIEIDGALVALDEQKLGVAAGPDLDIEIGDARIGVRRQPDAGYDLVVGDAFGHLAVPWHLTTAEFVADVRRVLRPDGVYVLNVIDYPPARFLAAEVATIRSVFPEVAVISRPEALAGKIGANFVVVAAAAKLPLERLRVRLAALATPTVVVSGPELSAVVGDARILTDDFAPVDQLINHA